ncbi:oligopeptide ABC transporter substrate-binding protein [Streptobacillus felis]|uniref:Oligopeptide ABC transporter substrate-binding protein n=1 Tax=Streptobacillus felis TaxID=1384509 RepID=A0A7Z0T8Z8_9FUSO|nr:oligopeptide ABC transporter substrate-binding protein [Streptobacillus felis]NYV28459.1 oligopeptide ABC transporter substrate-binding protein [Streptobacillus felis]
MKKILSASLILASLGLLVSCGPGQAKSDSAKDAEVSLNFPLEYKNDGIVDENAEFKIGLVNSSPFKGVLSALHYQDGYDGDILNYISEEIFWKNEDFEILDTEGGIATLSLDTENKKVIVKFKEGLKWSDGHPMGADDFIYTMEVLGHKDYTGIRYDESEHGQIVGMSEYHSGAASTISGVTKVSDTEVHIQLKENNPKVVTGGGPITSMSQLLPKHYLSDIAMKDLESSDKLRIHPLSSGKFVVKNVIPGEAIEFEANEYYHLGKPKVAKATLKTVAPQLVAESMKQGEYHLYLEVPQDAYDKYSSFDNLAVLGRPALYYSYLSFNLGHRDNEKNENFMDRDTPLQDVNLRKAIAYALNVDEAASAFYNGLRSRANGQTPPIFKKFYDPTNTGYEYNPEKAKEYLEKAGYKDSDGDGFVDKDGKKLTLKFATMGGSDVAEPLAQFYLQNWKEVGIDVVLTNGRLLEFQLFYEKVQANDPEIDIYAAAWGVGSSLDPSQTTSRFAPFNMNRFVSEENDKLLAAISDPKGLEDPNYKAEAYKKWHKYYLDQAVEVPLMFKYDVTPVNKAMKYYNLFTDDARSLMFEGVIGAPVKASN